MMYVPIVCLLIGNCLAELSDSITIPMFTRYICVALYIAL